MKQATMVARVLKKQLKNIKPIRRPYIPTERTSQFDHIREMNNVELTDWFKKHKHFNDKIKKGDRRPFVLKMVSKLQYADNKLYSEKRFISV